MSINYKASSALALTLTSLASSSSLTVGRCSTAYANNVNRDDFLIPTLKFRMGATTPTANTQGELWAFAQRADGTWPEIFTASYTGTDGGFTVVSRDILFAGARPVGSVTIDGTINRDYVIQGRELSTLFGYLPQQVAFFFTQSSAVALSTTSTDHVLTMQPGYMS